MPPADDSAGSAGSTWRKRRVADRDSRPQGEEGSEKSAAMAPADDSEESAGSTRRKRRIADRDSRPQDGEGYEKWGTKSKPPSVAPSRDLPPPSSDEDRSAKVYAMVGEHVRKMLTVHAEKKRLVNEFSNAMFPSL